MLYTLANGRTIDIPVEVYLDMTDEELHMLNGMNIGSESLSPFHNSVLTNGEISISSIDNFSDMDPDEIDEYEPDLTELESGEKLEELDIESFIDDE